MASILSDAEIATLVAMPKTAPPNFRAKLKLKEKRETRHKEAQVLCHGDNGERFFIRLRQNSLNVLDFSVILAFAMPGQSRLFRLRRLNGSSHPHTNPIERNRLVGFHRHMATERYQLLGMHEETYAEAATDYADIWGALSQMLVECHIVESEGGAQAAFDLFGEGVEDNDD